MSTESGETKTKDETNSTSAKKVLTQKNDNKVLEVTTVPKIQQITEGPETSSISKESEEEAVPNSQDPLKEQLDRRRSRRESFANKSTGLEKSQQVSDEKSEAEKKVDATRKINFDNNESPVRTLRNSPQQPLANASQKVTGGTKTPDSAPTQTNKNVTPIKTPEKHVVTPTVRSSPRKPGSSTETQHAAVPHPLIASLKSTSPTEASTANGADLETLNELRRSPRKCVVEIISETTSDQPAAAQMSPLKISVLDCMKDGLASPPDRRKSPRKVSNDVSPVQSDHVYAAKESSQIKPGKVHAEEETEEIDYQIEEPGSSDDNNESDSQTFLGEIVAPTSPTPDLDEKLEPIDRSMAIPSSPDISLNDEKTSEFLNNTIDISPIATGKSSPVTRLAAKNASAESPSATSPPDRKVTRSGIQGIVNLDSPKTSNVMQGGRGAHMMSMVFKQNSSTPNQAPTTSRSFNMGPPKHMQETRDILVFSKTLPGPDASPSASILKRKMDDSVDDIESPANKVRKFFKSSTVCSY